MSSTSFAELNLAPELLKALTESGYTTPTPIQSEAIPMVLQGRDLMAGAQTGTGKTAAFTLPMLQKLLPHASSSTSPARHPVRALVLAPTRELAIQVEENIKAYAKHIPLRSLAVYGGVDIKKQIPILRTGVEILVATPGRLLDHLEQKTVQLNMVQMLVLDEADRMLDMGFMPDLKRILAFLPKSRQSLMFSATFSKEIKKLSADFLVNPNLIEVARSNATAENVTQKIYPVEKAKKTLLLSKLVRDGEVTQAIVFTNTKIAANQVARHLQREGFSADAIHGDKSQKERLEVLEAFKQRKIAILIATDVAARGLDIDSLPFVINYDLPFAPEDYVHRIGRTGRAGASGTAISLVAPEEECYLSGIEKLINQQIDKVHAAISDVSHRTERPRDEQKKTPPCRAPVASKKASHDPWFDQPYEPNHPTAPTPPAATLSKRPEASNLKPKKQMPALFARRRSG